MKEELLKNVRDYLDEILPELKKDDYVIHPVGYCIDVILVRNIIFLEKKGLIKLTTYHSSHTECVRCGKELWLKDSEAGSNKNLLRVCDNCIDKFANLSP